MKETQIIMGMPVTVEVAGSEDSNLLAEVFEYFRQVDERFSTYKPNSEISRINRGELASEQYSPEMKEILGLSAQTKAETQGFFDIQTPAGLMDPSGLVKGWAIFHAAQILSRAGAKNYYVEAGGDIQTAGRNSQGELWRVGIKNPFQPGKITKILRVGSAGIATSGSYERGSHIYNPRSTADPAKEIISLTVIGPNVYEADRFATAAFAMGARALDFIAQRPELAGYMINNQGKAIFTNNLTQYA
jgi:thiamine biosynthesis lipoprotein